MLGVGRGIRPTGSGSRVKNFCSKLYLEPQAPPVWASILLRRYLLQGKVIVDGSLKLMGNPDPFASHTASVTSSGKWG